MNVRKDALKDLVTRFDNNITAYKDGKNAYNEHSCRIEYIDPFLQLLGWDVPNKAGLAPQYREVIAENYSNKTDRPDYSLTLRGVTKLFVEAKKPSVDIDTESAPAMQARKYGWNAKHKISILTNFEYFIIYDTTTVQKRLMIVEFQDTVAIITRIILISLTRYFTLFQKIRYIPESLTSFLTTHLKAKAAKSNK